MDIFNTMDDATAALIIELQIEDSQELFAACEGNGKRREGDILDVQFALQVYKEDLERNSTIIHDRQMTMSIARACQTDGNVVTAALSEEQAAVNDHEAACRLGGIAVSGRVEPWTKNAEEMDEELLSKLSALYVSNPLEDSNIVIDWDDTSSHSDSGQAESSAWAATRATPKSHDRECAACQDRVKFFDIARVPCGHEYCRGCLQDLYRSSMTDDSLFPPRCCRQPITCDGVRVFLTAEIVRSYEQKKVEFDTPDRTYCSNPVCSLFIRAENINNDQANCPHCATNTCIMCKAASHSGDCPADIALQQVLEAANEHGWQRCFSCRRLVELDVGCNHITCPCGAQFCYVCGVRWRQCQCPQWDEDRLFARGNQVVARRPNLGDNVQQAARLAAVVQNLRDRHNCDHTHWQYIRGQHQCEECYHTLPSYIFECRQCNIQACNRCRRNRL